MKRIALFMLVGFILGGGSLFAQSLKLSDGTTDFTNDTLYLVGTTDDSLLEAHIQVHNSTDKEVEVKAKKSEVSIVEKTENTFCWGACFPPFISESPDAIKIAAEGTDANSFVGDYSPNGEEGTSVIRYTFFVASNPDDSVSLWVYYQVGAAGLVDWTIDPSQIHLYPNPANQDLHVVFPAGLREVTTFTVLNLTGQTVLTEQILPGETKKTLDVSIYPRGHYFIGLANAEGQRVFRKFIISR